MNNFFVTRKNIKSGNIDYLIDINTGVPTWTNDSSSAELMSIEAARLIVRTMGNVYDSLYVYSVFNPEQDIYTKTSYFAGGKL